MEQTSHRKYCNCKELNAGLQFEPCHYNWPLMSLQLATYCFSTSLVVSVSDSSEKDECSTLGLTNVALFSQKLANDAASFEKNSKRIAELFINERYRFVLRRFGVSRNSISL